MDPPRYRLYALRYAYRDALRGEHFYEHVECCNEPMPLAYFVWAAIADETVVLIDTGFSAETARQRGRTYVASPAALLARLGVQPDAVREVVLTHLHYDHVGTVGDFANARTIQEREMAHWTGPDAALGANPHLVDAEDIGRLVHANLDGRVRWVEGAAEVAPGITVHMVGGHTPGMQIVRVHTAVGYAVVASDASHFYGNIEQNMPYSIVHKLPDMYRAFDTIRALADDPSLIVAGHDPEVLRRYAAASSELAGDVVVVA